MNNEHSAQSPSWKQEVVSFVKSSALLIVVYGVIRLYVAQPFIVRGMSMETTLADGDYVVVDAISYRFNDPKRYEIVVFRTEFLSDQNSGMYYIKRLIGLPGDRVVVDGDEVRIYNEITPEGFILDEPYLDPRHPNTFASRVDITLDEDEYFVLGDNRSNSSDSRFWGALNREYIVGKPSIRLFPFTDITVYRYNTFSQASL